MQQKAISYDATGDTHYDVTSAFIKSMRGSDPDAALYWLARMLEGGEDPRFIARRIAICASEDVGNATRRPRSSRRRRYRSHWPSAYRSASSRWPRRPSISRVRRSPTRSRWRSARPAGRA